MDTDRPLIVALSDPSACLESSVGAKAAHLARLAESGARVPPGFAVTVTGSNNAMRKL